MSSEFSVNRPKGDDSTDFEKDSNVEIDFNEHIIPYDNPLLSYSTVSWCFALYTVAADDLIQYQKGEINIPKMTIAETGVTGKYSIDSVNIHSTAPSQNSSKNSTVLKMNITLSEQGDMSFYDELQKISAMLGYNQVMNVPLFLALSFKGFKDNDNSKPIRDHDCNRLWRLRINNIKARADNNGGTMVYDIACTVGHMSPIDREWYLTEQIEFTCGNSVEAFTQNLESNLNRIANEQYGYMTMLFPNELQQNTFYKFFIHPDLKSSVLLNDPDQDSTKDKTVDGQTGARKYSFKPEQTISDALDSVMDSAHTKDDVSGLQKRQFVHVVPVSYYVGYDHIRHKMAYRYEIYILPLNSLEAQDVDDVKTKNHASDLLELLRKNPAGAGGKINMKRYDYQWSGLNTEILNLEYDFNASYIMVSTKNIQSLHDPLNRGGVRSSQLTATSQMDRIQVNQMYQVKKALDEKDKTTGLTAQERIELQAVNDNLEEVKQYQVEGQMEQATRSGKFTQDMYAEDLESYNIDDLSLIYPPEVKVPVDYSNQRQISSNTNDSTASQAEVEKRAARSNYYSDAQLLSVELKVIGDVHWLGKSELTMIDDMRIMIEGGKMEVYDLAPISNNLISDQCFILNIYPVTGFDRKTGLVKSRNNSFMRQGVYRILRIESTFDSKGFVQVLHAALIAKSVNRRTDG